MDESNEEEENATLILLDNLPLSKSVNNNDQLDSSHMQDQIDSGDDTAGTSSPEAQSLSPDLHVKFSTKVNLLN